MRDTHRISMMNHNVSEYDVRRICNYIRSHHADKVNSIITQYSILSGIDISWIDLVTAIRGFLRMGYSVNMMIGLA